MSRPTSVPVQAMAADVHPSHRLLTDFLLGKADDDDQAELAAHLDVCADCLRRATELQPHDTFVELIASAATRADSLHATEATPSVDAESTPTVSYVSPAAWGGAGQAPPTVLADHPRYRPVRLLGRGGMGCVWQARHVVMDRLVAVKVIRPECHDRPEAVARFAQEIRAAAGLKSPHIVSAYDAEAVDGTCLLVMEYVPGRNLAEVVTDGPLSVVEACRAIRDAARGLADAHAAGFVHRDVKPSNLIRTLDGVTKVLDFGLVAGPTDGQMSPSPAGLVLGTPDYMAPEQAGNPTGADARSDIYALGCTLYHLLAGRAPYPLNSGAEKLAAHRDPTRTPPPIPGLPQPLVTILERMLAKDPVARYQSAAEVAAALEPFCTPIPPANSDGRRRNRWPVAAGLCAAVAAVVLAGVVYKIYRDKQEITITTDDPEVEVVMKRNGDLVRIVDTKTKQAWELDPAKMRLKPDGGELSVDLTGRDPLVLRRNGDAVVTIRREPTAPPAGVKPPADPPDVPAVEELHRIPFAYAGRLDVSPDGKEFLAYTSQDGKRVAVFFDTATGKETGRFRVPDGEKVDIWLVPGSQDVIVCVDRTVTRCDRSTGAKRQDLFALPAGDTDYHACVWLSPDAGTACVPLWGAFGSGRHGVFVYDAKTGKERFRVKPLYAGTILGMDPRFSPDGKQLVTTDTTPTSSTIRVWDTSSGKLVKALDVAGALTCSVEFTNGGRGVVASYGGGADRNFVGVWDVATARQLRVTPLPTLASAAHSALHRGGDFFDISLVGATEIVFHDTRTIDRVGRFRPGEVIHGGATSADGQISVFATTTGLRVVRMPTPAAKTK